MIVRAHPRTAAKAPTAPPQAVDVTGAIQNGQPAAGTPPSQPAAAANTMTVTIIDGKTGAKQEVTVPSRGAATIAAATGSTLYQKLSETTAYGLIPKIAADGTRRTMARLQGYVGIINAHGARFIAAEGSLAPILSETAKRGLVYVDDGSNPASVAGRLAATDNVPFAQAQVIIDSTATPGDVDRALGRLEAAAHTHGVATGFASARPATIERIAQWAKTAADRGFLLVPISGAVSVKPSGSDDGLRVTQVK